MQSKVFCEQEVLKAWGETLTNLGQMFQEIVIFLEDFAPNKQESHKEFAEELFAMGCTSYFSLEILSVLNCLLNTMNILIY